MRRSHDCFESIHRLVGKFDPPSVPLKTEDVNSTCNDRARNVNRERLQLGTMMRPAGRGGRFRSRAAAAAVVDPRLIQTRWI
jgi:hypothetical protein